MVKIRPIFVKYMQKTTDEKQRAEDYDEVLLLSKSVFQPKTGVSKDVSRYRFRSLFSLDLNFGTRNRKARIKRPT